MKVCFPATFVAGVMLCAVPAIFAQQGPPVGNPGARPGVPAAPSAPPASQPVRAATPTIAVIDIAKIFKGHIRFNAMMQDIKKEIEDFDTYVKNESGRLKAMGEQLQTYRSGSIEYRQKEEEAAKLTSELQVKVGLKKKGLLEQEARVYFQVYRELEQKVAVFSQQYGISLVLRFNSEDMKEEDRNSVLQGVNRAVVYYNPQYDITNYILVELNKGYNVPAQPGPSPTANPGGQGIAPSARLQLPGARPPQ